MMARPSASLSAFRFTSISSIACVSTSAAIPVPSEIVDIVRSPGRSGEPQGSGTGPGRLAPASLLIITDGDTIAGDVVHAATIRNRGRLAGGGGIASDLAADPVSGAQKNFGRSLASAADHQNRRSAKTRKGRHAP
jgi:hypothetical protein